MTSAPYNVLILCTGNSARSILGEVAFNNLPACKGKFRGYSAGSHPKGAVNPFALEFLLRNGLPVEGLWSKSWDDFARSDSPTLDFVITVCDQAAGEQCPYWPGQPMTAHWGMPDPAAVEGSDEEKLQAFAQTYQTLRRRIEIFASLPIEKLDRLTLQGRVRGIARQ
jgi:arsenate reductase